MALALEANLGLALLLGLSPQIGDNNLTTTRVHPVSVAVNEAGGERRQGKSSIQTVVGEHPRAEADEEAFFRSVGAGLHEDLKEVVSQSKSHLLVAKSCHTF